MNIVVKGINHKTAPIDIREQFFLTHTQQDLLLSELKSRPEVCEAIVLSTCNRTEVYLHLLEHITDFGFLHEFFVKAKNVSKSKNFEKYFYTYNGNDAINHLFTVSAGLDSMVLGENQILTQLKGAVERAKDKAMLNRYFNVLSNMAVRTGKKARTETDINYGGSSVSWASVVIAEKMLGNLDGRSVLIIGAGKMGELALNQICAKNGSGKVYVMNRTERNAQKLAERLPVEAVSLYEIKDVLSEVDLCICSSGAPHYILERKTLQKVMVARNFRPLILVDISMPRNIDPEVAEIDNVSLFMIDDLDKFVDRTMQTREKAVPEVEEMIRQKIKEFAQKIAKLPQTGLSAQIKS